MPSINSKTKIYISVAKKPGNFGATVYNKLFDTYGINAVYIPRKAPECPEELLRVLRVMDIAGCSVTLPLKSAVLPFLDSLDDVAKATSSVNTIVQNDNGSFHGCNSDVAGVCGALENVDLSRVLIYGSGSVVGSISYALSSLGAKEVFITGRNEQVVQEVARKWKHQVLSVAEVDAQTAFSLLINATPASNEEEGHELFSLLPMAQCIFDVLPSLTPTKLVNQAKAKNKEIVDGISMYIHQVQKQCEFYTGIVPSLEEIEAIIKGSQL